MVKSYFRVGTLMLFLVMLITALPAFGDESETVKNVEKLDDVVVKSSKMERKIENLTDSVTVIDELDIELEGFTDTTEILRLTPSVEFKQAGGPGQFSYPKMRGYGQGHFLVLLNGMKINEVFNAGVGNFLGQLDTSLIESVEILRGPQASLYGSDTTAGVMAFETISGEEGCHFNAGFEFGSLGWKKAYSSVRAGSGNWNYAIGAAYTDSDGVHDDEYYKNFSPTFKVNGRQGDVDVEFAYLYVDSEFQAAELDEPNSFLSSRSEAWAFQTPDPNNANEAEYHVATLNLSHEINDKFRQKMLVGWFEKEEYRNDLNDGLLGYQSSPFDNFTFNSVTYNRGDQIPIYDDGTGVAYGYNHKNMLADYNLIWDNKIGEADNSTLFGVEYLYQEGGKWGKYGDLSADNYNYSLYLNDQLLLLNDALVLSAGVRQDNHEVYGSETTGKTGAAYTFPTSTTLFANYGTSFRAPAIFNLYDAVYGNEDITPETGWTVESGIRQEWMEGRIDGEVTGWYSELDNVIVFDYSIPNENSSVGSGKYANRDSAETSGVEVAFGAKLTDHVDLKGNYTYTHSYSEQDGERFRTVQIARNKGSITLSYKADRYNLGITEYYSGPRLRWKGDVEMEEYFRLDCFARYLLTDTVSLYTRIENLLDENIEEGLGYEEPGFYGIVGVEFKI